MYGSAAVVTPGAWQHIVVGANGGLWRWERRMRQGWVLEDATKAKACLMQCFDSEDLPDGRSVSPYRGIPYHGRPERPKSPDPEPEHDSTSPAYPPSSPAYSPNSPAHDSDSLDDKYDKNAIDGNDDRPTAYL
ncbi:hypothetical protein CYMTET_24407 [Cymbomonas tetramitiformis]|uniref:Uncharacterized protein n=1 Tax=Cymbomonas tetramitiformis TaxID=36881 RepID=A0AAE0L036_9CHLO|nr:hypothetical protein CYMTET_24407 [Cymbomonas tetramitiformis]